MEFCRKCKRLFETEENFKSIICSGPCSGHFHNMCTNLNENEISSLKFSTNIKWFCEDCSKSLDAMKNDSNESILNNFERKHYTIKVNNSNLTPKVMGTRIKVLIIGVFLILTLLIMLAVLGCIIIKNTTTATNSIDGKTEGECSSDGNLCFIDREVWRAQPQLDGLEKQKLPLHRVIIAHTATEECSTIKICAERIRLLQEFHMNSFGWSDIGYNFLIGGDGRVYVGRGWDISGTHTKGFNMGSVGIAFIGTFVKDRPTEEQLKACLMLLEEGVRLKKLSPNYRLYAARQLSATESPGATLYNIIQKWTHWSMEI